MVYDWCFVKPHYREQGKIFAKLKDRSMLWGKSKTKRSKRSFHSLWLFELSKVLCFENKF